MLGAGVLGDRIGRRKLLVASCVAMALGQILSALAPDGPLLIAGRAGAGIGLAGVFGTVPSFLRTLSAEGELHRATTRWLALQMFFVLVGAMAAGALLAVDYRAGYLFLAALAVFGAVIARRVLPESRSLKRPKLDLVGIGLAATGVSVLLWGLSRLPEGDSDFSGPGTLLVGLMILVVFVMVEGRRSDPALPVRLLRRRPVAAACVAGFVTSFGVAALLFALVSYQQYLSHWSADLVTLAQEPMTLAMAVTALVLGAWGSGRVPLPAALGIGLLVLALGDVLAAPEHSASALLALVGATMVAGIGAVAVQSFETSTLLGAVEPERAGTMSALRGVVDFLGVATGLAVMHALLQAASGPFLAKAIAQASADPATRSEILRRVLTGPPPETVPLTPLQAPLSSRAHQALLAAQFAHAVNVCVYVTAAVVLTGAVVAVVLLRPAWSPLTRASTRAIIGASARSSH